jgi:hypothetical protein
MKIGEQPLSSGAVRFRHGWLRLPLTAGRRS